MKKIFTFLIAIATVSFASAQSYRQPERSYQGHNEKQYAYNDHNDRNGYYNEKQRQQQIINERQRQEQIDYINRDYDQQINVYRNDRRMSQRERDRRIYQLNNERNIKLKSFGSGAAVGVFAGLILGSILSH
ncbi:MAG: hypothetical protein QM764_14070 [Chitinophagaceae bacterium]